MKFASLLKIFSSHSNGWSGIELNAEVDILRLMWKAWAHSWVAMLWSMIGYKLTIAWPTLMGTRDRGANGPPELVALGVASVKVSLDDGLIWGRLRWPIAQFLSYETERTTRQSAGWIKIDRDELRGTLARWDDGEPAEVNSISWWSTTYEMSSEDCVLSFRIWRS
jgi:hypothetical protein